MKAIWYLRNFADLSDDLSDHFDDKDEIKKKAKELIVLVDAQLDKLEAKLAGGGDAREAFDQLVAGSQALDNMADAVLEIDPQYIKMFEKRFLKLKTRYKKTSCK